MFAQTIKENHTVLFVYHMAQAIFPIHALSDFFNSTFEFKDYK